MPESGSMTPRERMRTAMELKVPDRVPVMCQLAIGHYFLHTDLDPMDIWFTSEGFAEACAQLQKRYQFDGVLVNLPGRLPDYQKYVDRIETKKDIREYWLWWKNGNYTVIPWEDNPHYFQADGSRYFPTFDEVNPDDLWYVEPWDLTDITWPYTWAFEDKPRPFDNFFPEYHLDGLRAVKKKVGDTVSVHMEVFSPFAQFLELLNYECALMSLLDNPDKAHACLARLTEGALALADSYGKEGVDAILISSAFAGAGMISCDMYEEFVLPYERRLIKETQAKHTIPFYTHTCGAIGDRLELIMETGTNGVDTLDPPPLGTVELEEAVKVLKGKVFIKGNLDPVNTLLRGDEKAVDDAVRHRLRVAAPGGGYILSSACSVAPAVKPELMEYMTALVRKLGVYPIQL